MGKGFTESDVPRQDGKTALVTGANTGIGFHTARVLALSGARVLLGCRSMEKATDAKARILADHPEADVDIVELDLGDLASVRAAAARIEQEPRLDLLINNAGLMMPPFFKTTDGFESQYGVNHLGTFALTGLLLDKLEQTPGSRVLNTSSNGHKAGKVDFENLNAEKKYSAFAQYAMSKLANLLHTFELDRRLRAAGRQTVAVAVHPGGSDTDLGRHIPKLAMTFMMPVFRPFMNTAAQGAWPTLMAATAPDVSGGQYFGPSGFMEMAGPAKRVDSNALSKDEALAKKLWDVSVRDSGVDPSF